MPEIKMVPTTARDLLTWYEKTSEVSAVWHKSQQQVMLLAGLSGDGIGALCASIDPRDFIPTARGMAVLASSLPLLITTAKAIHVEVPMEVAPPMPLPASDAAPKQFEAPEEGRREKSLGPTISYRLCDPSEALKRLELVAGKQPEKTQMLKELSTHPLKWLPIATRRTVAALTALESQYPNFQAAVDAMRTHLMLAAHLKNRIGLPPMLLQGPPGVGKTAFAQAVAKAIGFNLGMLSFAEASAGFLINGSSSTWSSAGAGWVARILVETPSGQAPMLLVDELDKCNYGSHPPDRPLLGALEHTSARRFRDEYLDVELDATAISWLFTANRLDRIRPEIRSRMQVVEVSTPSRDQMRAVIRSVDAGLRSENPGLGRAFLPLGEDLITELGSLPPRELRRKLLHLYALTASKSESDGQMLSISVDLLGASKAGSAVESEKLRKYEFSLLLPESSGRLH